jgi:hypothetical protein
LVAAASAFDVVLGFAIAELTTSVAARVAAKVVTITSDFIVISNRIGGVN